MAGPDRSEIERVFRLQAAICRAGSADVAADLLEYAAGETRKDGPITRVVADWPRDPVESYLGVRFLAAIHRLVLTGRALELSSHFPSAGGRPKWPYLGVALTELAEEHAALLREWIEPVPQTNEVGRAAALSLGFHRVARDFALPLRILELGASAGLNLRWDAYRCEAGAHCWGPDRASVVIEASWEGPPPVLCEKVEVVARAGCEVAPFVLIEDPERRRLESYVWPDHVERLMRLRRAIASALDDPVRVEKQRAEEWLPEQLAEAADGVVTVVYHSSFWAYLQPSERAAIEASLESHAESAHEARPLAWLRLEEEGAGISLRLRVWPSGEDRKLAEVANNGASIRYLGA